MILMGALMGADRYGSQHHGVTVLEDVLLMWSPTMPSCTIWPMAMAAMATMATMADCRRGLVRCIWWSSSSVEVTRPSDFTRYKLFNSGINWYCSSSRKVLLVFFGVSCCISFYMPHTVAWVWHEVYSPPQWHSTRPWRAVHGRPWIIARFDDQSDEFEKLGGFEWILMDVNGRKWIWMGCGFWSDICHTWKRWPFLFERTRGRGIQVL